MIDVRLPAFLPQLHDTRSYSRCEETSPFARGPHERPIRFVVVDADRSGSPALDAILAFQHYELAEVITTAETSELPRLTIRPRVHENDFMPYRIDHHNGWTESHIWNAQHWLAMAAEHCAAHGGDLADVEH